jgi:hypothetical protein
MAAVSLRTKAWITAARLRRRLRSGRRVDRHRRRCDWIEQQAPGRSFADIGGLYGIAGEMALTAARSGADPVTLFDAGDAVLTEFPQQLEASGLEVRFVQGDLSEPLSPERIGVHDIVWCTGVLYHTPDPVGQLMALRQITGELLYLGTHVIPEVRGLENACVFYPGLGPNSRAAYASAHANAESLWGIGQPFNDRPMLGHGNFWWGVTPSALRSMLMAARLELVEELSDPEYPFYLDLVARPIDRPPVMPPLSYYRERGEARERGQQPPPFETYYESRP